MDISMPAPAPAALSIVAQLNDYRRRPAGGKLVKRRPLPPALADDLVTKISHALAGEDFAEILVGAGRAVVRVRFGPALASLNAPPWREIEATLHTPDRANRTVRARAPVRTWTAARPAEPAPPGPPEAAALPVAGQRGVTRPGYRLGALDTEKLRPGLVVAMLRAGVPGDKAAVVADSLLRGGLSGQSLISLLHGADGTHRYDAEILISVERFLAALEEQAVAPRPGGTGSPGSRLRRTRDRPQLRSRAARARLFPAGGMKDLDALLAYAASKRGLTVLRIDDPSVLRTPGEPATPRQQRWLATMSRLQERGKLLTVTPDGDASLLPVPVRRSFRRSTLGRLEITGFGISKPGYRVSVEDAARGYALDAAGVVSHGWTSAHAEVNPAVIDRPKRLSRPGKQPLAEDRPRADKAPGDTPDASSPEAPSSGHTFRKRLTAELWANPAGLPKSEHGFRRRPTSELLFGPAGPRGPGRTPRRRPTDEPLGAPAPPRPARPDDETVPRRSFDLASVAREVAATADPRERSEAIKRAAEQIVDEVARNPGDRAAPLVLDGPYLGDGLLLAYTVAQVTGRVVWARGEPVEGAESWFRADREAIDLGLAPRLGQHGPGIPSFMDERPRFLAYVQRHRGMLVRVTDSKGEHLARLTTLGDAAGEPAGLEVVHPDGSQGRIPQQGIARWAKNQNVKVTLESLRRPRIVDYVAPEPLGDLELGDDVRIPAYLRAADAWGGAAVVLRARPEILSFIARNTGIPEEKILKSEPPHVLRYSPVEVSGDGEWFKARHRRHRYWFQVHEVGPRGDWMTMSDEVEKLRIDVTNQGVSSTGSAGTQTTSVVAAAGAGIGPGAHLVAPVFTIYGDLTRSMAYTRGVMHQYPSLESARAEGDKGRRFLAGVNVALTTFKLKDGEAFNPEKLQQAIDGTVRFAVERGAEVKLPNDVTLTEEGTAKALDAAKKTAREAGQADESAVAPKEITFGKNATIGWLSVPLALSSLDAVRADLLDKLHARASQLTQQSRSTKAHLGPRAIDEVLRFLSQHNVRAHHREAATAVISSKMLYTNIQNLKGVPSLNLSWVPGVRRKVPPGLGSHAVPLGSAEFRMRPRKATLLKQYIGTELRGAVPAVTGASRRRTDASSRSLGAATGPAVTPAVSDYLKVRAGVLGGLRFLSGRSRFLNVGGSAAVNHMLTAKGKQTALYRVEHEVQVRLSGDGWSEPRPVYTWEHLTVEEAHRLARHEPQFTRRTDEPEPPDYLTDGRPAAPGLAYPADVSFPDGGHYGKDGNSVVEQYTDYVVRRISARYPDLVQPPEELNLLRHRNSAVKLNPRRLMSEYDEATFLRLEANLEKIRTEVRGALINNPAGLLTGGHDDRLTGSAAQDEITKRLVSHGIPLALKLNGVARNRYLVLTLHGSMTRRRYAGTAESFQFRSGMQGKADQGGGYRTVRSVEGTVDASLQLRDKATDGVSRQSRAYGGISLGFRGGLQWLRAMGYGGNTQAVTVGVVKGPAHAWEYDLDLYATMGGFARPKRWLRYLSLGIASWNRWIRELGPRDDPFRNGDGTRVKPVKAVITLLTPDSHSQQEKLPKPGLAKSSPLSAARTDWLLSGRLVPESAADKALQEKLAGTMVLPFYADSHQLTEAAVALAREVTGDSAPYARTGGDGVSAVRDTFEHLAANFRQLTGLTTWSLSGFSTRQAVGEWKVRYQVHRSLSNLQIASKPVLASELELSVLTERGASGGKSRVSTLSFSTGVAGTSGVGPEDAPDAMLAGGGSWTPWARQRIKGESESVNAVRDTNFIPIGPAYLVRADATDYVAAEGIRTAVGRKIPGSSVRRAGQKVEAPGSVYFYVTEEEAYELGLLRRHPSDAGRVLSQPWELKPGFADRLVAAYLRKQPDLSRFIAEVRSDLARQGFDGTDVDAVEAHLGTLAMDANFMEMVRGEVTVPLGHFGAKGMVAISLRKRAAPRFVSRDASVKWQHRIHALLARVVSRAEAKSSGYSLALSASKRQESTGLFAEGSSPGFGSSSQSARGTDQTVTEQRTYQVTDTSSAVLFDHDYDVVVTVRAEGREHRLSTPGTFRVAHPLSSADPVQPPAAGAVVTPAPVTKPPDPVTRPLDYADATEAGIMRWLNDHQGRVHHLLGVRGHLRPVPMDTDGQRTVTEAVRRAVAASERSFLDPRSGASAVTGTYELGAGGLTKHGRQSDDAIRNATTTHSLGAFLQEALHRDGKLGPTGYRIPGVMRRGISADVTLYAKAGFPRDAEVIAYDPNLRMEKPARLITGTDSSAIESSVGLLSGGPVLSAVTGIGNATPSGPTMGSPEDEAVADTVPTSELVSQNEKLTGPAYLVRIPVTWRAVAEVKHQAADRVTGGTSQPRAFEAQTYVVGWLDEVKAMELGFVTRKDNEALRATKLKQAEQDVRQQLERYWTARRALNPVPHAEDEQTEQDKELIKLAGEEWAKVVLLEDKHRRVRGDVNRKIHEISAKLAASGHPKDVPAGSRTATQGGPEESAAVAGVTRLPLDVVPEESFTSRSQQP
jgi:hypothetical protein